MYVWASFLSKVFVKPLILSILEFFIILSEHKLFFFYIFLFSSLVFLTKCNFFIIFGYLLFLFTNLISFFLLNHIGLYGSFYLNFLSIVLFWVSLLCYFDYFLVLDGFIRVSVGDWFPLSLADKVSFDFYIDYVSYSFAFLTVTIAVFVYCYAFSYFRLEPHVDRLLIYLNLFVASMVLLVCAGNVFMLFFGWELIGLTSFLLINFWITRVATLKAAFKAFFFNKISDISLFLFCIFSYTVTYDYDIIIVNVMALMYVDTCVNFIFIYIGTIEFLCILLIISAIIKSAQFGPHIWLPDSMEAPVPASALIHSATLVSAGIFLFLRFQNLFEYSTLFVFFLPVVGALTALYGGLVACYQTDIKRALAYSTISHCGFLVVSCSSFCYEYTILYLYVHGIYKAASFLCIGNIIRFNNNNQDMRMMGSFCKYMPFECTALFLCFINLSGLPFTCGYVIKHLLLITLVDNFITSFLTYSGCFLGALTGIIYCYRLYYYIFFDYKKSRKYTYLFHQSDKYELNFSRFSTTTLASNSIIASLIIVGYLLCIYLYLIFNNNEFMYSSNFQLLTVSSIHNFLFSSYSLNFNYSFFSVVFVLLFFMFMFSSNKESTFFYFDDICYILVILIVYYIFTDVLH